MILNNYKTPSQLIALAMGNFEVQNEKINSANQNQNYNSNSNVNQPSSVHKTVLNETSNKMNEELLKNTKLIVIFNEFESNI